MPPGDWVAGERGMAALPEREAEFAKSLDMAIDYAKIIGSALFHMMAGLAPARDLKAIATYRDNLKRATDRTGAAGIGLVIEPINRRDMPRYFLNDFNQELDLIAEMDSAHLKLQFDVYHRQIQHGDVIMGHRACAALIGHIQIASVPDRHELLTGELDDHRIFAEIDSISYRRNVGCEYRPAPSTREGLGWMTKGSD